LSFACDEERVRPPNLRLFVGAFRAGLDGSGEVSIEIVHTHPLRLLTRRHASREADYERLRRALGLRKVGLEEAERQISWMQAGTLPATFVPPSVDDLVTFLKVLLLSDPEREDVTFYVLNLRGFWRIRVNPRPWEVPKSLAEELLLGGRLSEILLSLRSPRSEMERRYSELFQEYFVLRNQIAQLYSEDALEKFQRGNRTKVDRERLWAEKRLRRLSDLARGIGILLELENYPVTGLQPEIRPQLPGPRVAWRD
jgi:hypothetical protein